MTDRRLEDKLRHIDAALDGQSEVPNSARPGAIGFEHVRFRPRALPEVDLDEIDLSLEFLRKKISAPIMISPMTGGLKKGGDLNRRMAAAAEALGLPFGVGSQRVALEVEGRAIDFKVRGVAPTIPLFANLGAVQLVKGYGPDEARRAVDMIEADALFLHLNAMQEVAQLDGDTSWSGVTAAIEKVCEALDDDRIPVFAREVGFGMSKDDAERLVNAGVRGLDCAGAGGTSWSLVEGRVAAGTPHEAVGRTMAGWGLSTVESIQEVSDICRASRLTLIGSGGVRSGLDVGRGIALGADLMGMASPVLRAAAESEEAVDSFLRTAIAELRAVLFGVGARDLAAFRAAPRLLLPGQGG